MAHAFAVFILYACCLQVCSRSAQNKHNDFFYLFFISTFYFFFQKWESCLRLNMLCLALFTAVHASFGVLFPVLGSFDAIAQFARPGW